MARSGLHQHQGVATSQCRAAGLTDYRATSASTRWVSISGGFNHDAIAYESTLPISRLEGPVTYPEEAGDLHGLHTGARHATVRNDAPDVPPEINVPCLNCVLQHRDFGVRAPHGSIAVPRRRSPDALLENRPGSASTSFAATSLIEMWVYGAICSRSTTRRPMPIAS
ncbi:MAG: hypothetical protein R3E68_11920 [Burkholderiaceae bacterium]